jgi:hypothetical protein
MTTHGRDDRELGGEIMLDYPSDGFHAKIELPIENLSS